MGVGGIRTSVELELEFWACLAELAAARRASLPALVGEVAAAKPRSRSLASALRVFALDGARRLLGRPANGHAADGPPGVCPAVN
jgi:predicted DNA-binding ribbon-helix-helix protein